LDEDLLMKSNTGSKVLVIDNYDSFTFNLVQYLGELGALPRVVRNDRIGVNEILKSAPDRIVLSPGPGRPEDAGICVDLLRAAAGLVPVLGVCLGHQAIGIAFGGKVLSAPTLMHGKTSDVEHDGKTIFKGIRSPMTATRYHSLMVDTETLPDCLEISAHSGDGVIMAMRHRRFPIEGVQFHPESILTVQGRRILENFLSA
jgi:anthranilate synthase/aminodeoxychorismate synthase-like glutamine amidotransferase